MPSDPLDILSLDAAKAALRIDGNAGDADLTSSIKAAVDYCQRLCGKPFLDLTEDLYVSRPALSDAPMRIPRRDVKSIAGIRYWMVAQELREEPSGIVMVGPSDPPVATDDPIGRRREDGYDTLVWPPAAGWPEVLTGSSLLVKVTTGFADAEGDREAEGYDIAADIPGIAGIRKAVALQTSVYNDGIVEDTHRRAVLDLLRPYMDARGLV